MRSVCVLGLGLIGGSVLRASVAAGRTAWAATVSPVDREAAAAEGFSVAATVSDALRRAVEDDALVVVATPLPAVAEVLGAVAEVAPQCLLTDVVSVKSPVSRIVRRILPGARYVGGHPMAGNSVSGWTSGRVDLFTAAAWVVATDDTEDVALWSEVARFALDCGAHVVPVPSAEHDVAVAKVSHLPHVLASVLASVGAEGGALPVSLAAGSFRDGTRVAGSRPELVRAMCEGNRDGLVDALDVALRKLGAARASLVATGSLASTIDAGHAGRQAYAGVADALREEVAIRLDAPNALDALAQLGRDGGRVVRIEGAIATAVRPGPDIESPFTAVT